MKRNVFKVKSVKRIDRELGKTKMFKRCRTCGELKFINDFHKKKQNLDNKRSNCKLCAKKYREENKEKIKKIQKRYYKENEVKLKEHGRIYRENNKEKIREGQKKYRIGNKEKLKQWREDNEEKLKEYDKQYRKVNKEKIKEYRKQYNERNKEKIKEYRKQYRKVNKKKIKEKLKRWREENEGIIKEYNKQYRKENRERIKERNKKKYQEEKEEVIKSVKINFTRNFNVNETQYGLIYKITCKNGRVYIGQTTRNFDMRYPNGFFWDKHYHLVNAETKQSLMDDYNQYGEEGFTIDKCIDVAFSPEELDKLEVYYIDKYKAYDEGYNSNRGYINGRTTLYKKWEEENK